MDHVTDVVMSRSDNNVQSFGPSSRGLNAKLHAMLTKTQRNTSARVVEIVFRFVVLFRPLWPRHTAPVAVETAVGHVRGHSSVPQCEVDCCWSIQVQVDACSCTLSRLESLVLDFRPLLCSKYSSSQQFYRG